MSDVRDAEIRFLFEKGTSGFRFSPAFSTSVSDSKVAGWFGPHNESAYLLKDQEGRIEGVRLRCQLALRSKRA